MPLEPDHRAPQVDTSKVAEIDWDNLKSTYEAPALGTSYPTCHPSRT